jgi:hypothetical protein
MKTFLPFFLLILSLSTASVAQDYTQDYHIKTIFNNRGPHASGGFGAMTNKFTTINGDFANIVELYGGWYINHRWLVGLEGAASTNDIPVPSVHSTNPGYKMSYEYGQCGLMTEYVFGSDKAVHVALQLFAGAGFTLQYQRPDWRNEDYWNNVPEYEHDENWFYVAEPGVKVEVNVFRWLRFCPGISYRKAYKSGGRGLTDNDISGTSINLTLKLGRF